MRKFKLFLLDLGRYTWAIAWDGVNILLGVAVTSLTWVLDHWVKPTWWSKPSPIFYVVAIAATLAIAQFRAWYKLKRRLGDEGDLLFPKSLEILDRKNEFLPILGIPSFFRQYKLRVLGEVSTFTLQCRDDLHHQRCILQHYPGELRFEATQPTPNSVQGRFSDRNLARNVILTIELSSRTKIDLIEVSVSNDPPKN